MLLKRLIASQPHPFRLLLILEWILLGLSALQLFGIPGWYQTLNADYDSETTILEVVPVFGAFLLFGIMGLRLPTSGWGKFIYTAIAFVLIAIPALWSLDSLAPAPLLIIILLRSCLIFGRTGKSIIAGLMGFIYPLTITPFILFFWLIFNPEAIQDWQVEKLAFDITITSSGGLQLNLTPEQVQKCLSIVQKYFLDFLVDSTLFFGLAVISLLLLVNSLLRERKGRRRLAQAHEKLYQYSLQIEDKAVLEERNRIAREIHDSLGHLLTAQTIQLENALLSLPTNLHEVETFLTDGKQLGRNALDELRRTIYLLRSDPLQGQSLRDAIARIIFDFSQTRGIIPDYKINLVQSLPQRIEIAIYRIMEEALTNISKHSEATEVKIILESNNSSILLIIEDNGRGYNVEENYTGFGLQGMRERTESLQGQFQITSQPGNGCRVKASFPL